MEKIIQITSISKEEFFDRIEEIIEQKLRTVFNPNINHKLSIKEVSEELGVSTLTVHNYIKRGTLKALKLGNRVWIKRSDLDEALQEKKSLKYKR